MKNISLFFLAIFSVVFAASCGGDAKQDPAAELAKLKDQKTSIEAKIAELEKQVTSTGGAAPKIRIVGLTEVKQGLFRHYIDLQGKVEADQSVQATSKVPGTLTRILVNNGDVVRKGQLIATLDDEVMKKALSELELQLRVAQDVFNRQKGLWDQKIGTEIAYIQAKTNMEAMEQRIATTKEQMSMNNIYAPVAGTVEMVTLKVGQAIAPGFQLCNIVNLSGLKIKGEVTEAFVSKVKKGDQVQVFFPDLNKEITTRVTFVSKTINPMSRTFTVECALPGGADYRVNQVAVMKIVDYQNANALTVPVNLIQVAEDGEFILIAEKTGEKQGTVKKINVKQGSNYNGEVEILNGLKKGDFVISTGFQDVNNGETIAF